MRRALVKCMGIALAAAAVATTAAAPLRAQAVENVGMLFDFEDEADLKDWSAFENERMKAKDTAPRLEWSAENATAGARSLKLTYTKGKFAGITTAKLPVTEWKPPLTTFHADVTATRDCVVLFRGVPQKTREATDPKNEGPVFVKVARLAAGKNHVQDIVGYGSYATPGTNSGPI